MNEQTNGLTNELSNERRKERRKLERKEGWTRAEGRKTLSSLPPGGMEAGRYRG